VRVFVCACVRPSVRPSARVCVCVRACLSRSELQGFKFSFFARKEVLVKLVRKCKNQTSTIKDICNVINNVTGVPQLFSHVKAVTVSVLIVHVTLPYLWTLAIRKAKDNIFAQGHSVKQD
jgi:hypothetical protein